MVIVCCTSFVSSPPLKYRAYQVNYTDLTTDKTGDWSDINQLVTVEMTEKVVIYGQEEFTYDIIKLSQGYVNSDGDTIFSADALDEKSRKCNVSIIMYKDDTNLHVATLTITYGNYKLYYRLKNA